MFPHLSHEEETRPLCGARAGPAKHLGLSVRETNRRPFGARCDDDPLWIILDNQHPWYIDGKRKTGTEKGILFLFRAYPDDISKVLICVLCYQLKILLGYDFFADSGTGGKGSIIYPLF